MVTTKNLEIMGNEKQRELLIESLVDLLKHTPFSLEYVVKKNPKGIKVSIEVTKEQLDEIMAEAIEVRRKMNTN